MLKITKIIKILGGGFVNFSAFSTAFSKLSTFTAEFEL